MKKNIQITNGPIGRNLFLFTVPIILTGLLQLCYNMADVIVVGQFAGKESLAAVGSTSSLTNLFINLFMGMSIGASVCTAQYIGSKNQEGVSKAVHTAVALSLVGGVIIGIAGVLLSKQMLILMDTPANILDEAALYMKIIFLGMPANMAYNFGAGIIRAAGDSKHPLIFLAVSGLVNVALNLVMVICFHMGAAGVAIATVSSQVLSAILVLLYLTKKNPICKLQLRKLRIHTKFMKRILHIGVPAGIQGTVFSLSNVIIQSSINSFGDIVVAGSSASASVEGLCYICLNAVNQAMITFVGQNAGAGKMERIKKCIFTGLWQVAIIWGVSGGLVMLFGEPLLKLYAPGEPEVIANGLLRLWWIVPPYLICGFMEVLVGAQRGMGTSLMPMIASIIGVCGVRIVWVFTVFAAHRTLEILFSSYAVSWTVTTIAHAILCTYVYKNLKKKYQTT